MYKPGKPNETHAEWLKRMREMAESEPIVAGPEEGAPQGPVKLSFWRDRERAVPTAIIRSALFGVVRPGRRPYVQGQLVVCWKNCEIRYTGGRLDQYDEDVWMQVLHFARQQDLSDANGIRFTARGFIKAMGSKYSGSSSRSLHRSLERMTATAVSIRIGSFVYVGSLIDSFGEDRKSGCYVVQLNPAIRGLFDTGYTKMQVVTRRALPSDLARWLYGYVQSHKATQRQPHRIGLSRLQALAGSDEGNPRKFRLNVRRSMGALQAAGKVASWRITEGDALEFIRSQGGERSKGGS